MTSFLFTKSLMRNANMLSETNRLLSWNRFQQNWNAKEFRPCRNCCFHHKLIHSEPCITPCFNYIKVKKDLKKNHTYSQFFKWKAMNCFRCFSNELFMRTPQIPKNSIFLNGPTTDIETIKWMQEFIPQLFLMLLSLLSMRQFKQFLHYP